MALSVFSSVPFLSICFDRNTSIELDFASTVLYSWADWLNNVCFFRVHFNVCWPDISFTFNISCKRQVSVSNRAMFNECCLMFNATFNNISVISWRSVLLVEKTREPGENRQPIASGFIRVLPISSTKQHSLNICMEQEKQMSCTG
jgi:hypothetical protein